MYKQTAPSTMPAETDWQTIEAFSKHDKKEFYFSVELKMLVGYCTLIWWGLRFRCHWPCHLPQVL